MDAEDRALQSSSTLNFTWNLSAERLPSAQLGLGSKSQSNAMKIFFDHIPKTAGTSIQHFFVDAFGMDSVSAHVKGIKLESAFRMYSAKKVLIGHFGVIPDDKIPDGYLSATILRNPQERALSFFYYQKNDVPDAGLSPQERTVKALSLEEALWDDRFVGQISNTQSTHFASYFHPTPEKLAPALLLAYAKRGLEQYDFVGTLEKIHEFVDVLKLLLMLPSSLELKRKNVTSDRLSYKDIPQSLQRRIDELTEVDQQLWTIAQTTFDLKKKDPKRILPVPLLACNEPSSIKPVQTAGQATNFRQGAVDLLDAHLIGRLRSNSDFISGELADLHVVLRCNEDIEDFTLGYSIHHDSNIHMFGVNSRLLGDGMRVRAGAVIQLVFSFPVNLGIGNYYVNLAAHTSLSHLGCCYLLKEKLLTFSVVGFMDVAFEGLARLMPSLNIALLNNDDQTLLEVRKEPKHVQKIGEVTPAVLNPQGSISILTPIGSSRPGVQLTIPVVISNESDQKWSSEGTRPVLISYHWRTLDNTFHIQDGIRTPLPMGAVFPGTSANGTALVETPPAPGTYILEMTLVKEGEFWFEDRGFTHDRKTVVVK